MNFNKTIILGNITNISDKMVENEKGQLFNFSVAVNRSYKNASGEKKQDTTFFNVVCFNNNAKFVHKYAKVGDLILVDGNLKIKDHEGKRYVDLVAEKVELKSKQEEKESNF